MPPAAPKWRDGPNLDEREIRFFNHHEKDWWERKGRLKALHDINPLRRDYVAARAGAVAGREILDVGCGGGLLSEALAAWGGRVMGIDLSGSALAAARAHRENSGLSIDYRQAAAEALAVEMPGCFDIIVCMELLEHVPEPRSILTACERLAKPGGNIFVATINRTWLARLLVIFMAEYILHVVEKGTHHYHRFIQPRQLAEWADASGLTVCDCSGFLYLPLAGRAYLTRFAPMNYLMHLKKRRD